MASLKAGVKVTSRLGSIVGEMSGVDYLMIHEYGGTIRARNSEYLTIPLPAALNAGGTPKKRSAREWNNTFIGQSKAGNMIIFQRNGRGVIPLYVLEKEVKLRARLGLRKTQAEQMDVFVAKVAMLVTKEIME